MKLISTLLAIASVLAIARPLSADVAPPPRPQWTAVQMESELVEITLAPERVQVKATFNMANHGKDANIVMGFPLGLFEESLNDFSATIDGNDIKDIRTVETAAASGGPGAAPAPRDPRGTAKDDGFGGEAYRFEGPYKQWKVWSVPMKASGKHIVTVSYWVKPAAIKDADKGPVSFYSYTLKTGALWKGQINEAIVRVTLDKVAPTDIVRKSPAAGQSVAMDQNKHILVWTFKDFKPTENIEISWTAPATK